MNAKEFSKTWAAPLVKYTLASPAASGLSEAVRDALGQYGLPTSAEPWLQFTEILRTDERTAAALDELHFYPIGYLPGGDLICMDKATDRVMICDHEEPDYTWILNSSLEALYESVTLYADFIREVNLKNPRFASDFKIPDGMLAKLEADLKACDPAAFGQKGFWFTEIQALDDSAV